MTTSGGTADNKLTTSRDSKVQEVYWRMVEWIMPKYDLIRVDVEERQETWELGDVKVVIKLTPNIFDPVAADVYQDGEKINTAWNHRGLSDILTYLGVPEVPR